MRRFARLRTDKVPSRWTAKTMGQAPHKPLLLLCVLDLFEREDTHPNFIEFGPDLSEAFYGYWATIFPSDQRGNIALPFFHLRSERFWHLLPKPDREEALHSASQIRSPVKLGEHVIGARLDEALYGLLHEREYRDSLRSVLLDTYFASGTRRALARQVAIDLGAFIYSEELLRNPGDSRVRETLPVEEAYRPAVRDQGFRRAVVTAYAHRCALCGVRVRTLDGHTVVTAAHIIPWSEGHDDRPANGMALCRTCHWTFDEGLVRVSTVYEIRTSDQLTVVGNLSGYLTSLEGRGIVGPSEKVYWPDPASLRWHHQHVFRRG